MLFIVTWVKMESFQNRTCGKQNLKVVVGGAGGSSSIVVVAVSQFLTDAFSQLMCSIVV